MNVDHTAPRTGAAAPRSRTHGAPVAAAAWDLRIARAVPFALVCTLVAAAGHALGGGGEVAVPALVAGFAVVCALAALLGGRERSLLAISGALGAGQFGLHLLFHNLPGFGFATAMPGMGGGVGMGGAMTLPQVAGRLLCHDSPHGGLTLVPLDTTPEQVVRAAGLDPQAYTATAAVPHPGLLGMSTAMLLGHLAAALLAGWWLRRGEATLWRLVRLTATVAQEYAAPLRTAFALLAALLLGTATDRRPTGPGPERAEDWRLPVAAALRHSLIRRGPPVAAFAR
ncbi:hypothetical protein [Kitasatospora sp. MAP5-34]|uniref:hypothetical protein n=1 Tax=Kitasatospora sp. MAP5-34 TaxID=3035102 RepID=UPI0024751773|nr:hypothetical protein [Kitasatospora sp. MAP5-34]MDH6577469.1 hypothetical protein [Kitasatospora sp. MAP5-34]